MKKTSIMVMCILLFESFSYAQPNKYILKNTDTCILKGNHMRDFQQVNILKVSGIIIGKVLYQTRNVTDNGFDTIKEERLSDITQQYFVIRDYFDRILIVTSGVAIIKLRYIFFNRQL